ncbi:hypothetical protein, partial [Pseudonocardia acidicola]|uniref:hypothetical protein n=1 Tax=Pseudonocardia acidicola TaxID=2724939 RepID=UPI001B7CED73
PARRGVLPHRPRPAAGRAHVLMRESADLSRLLRAVDIRCTYMAAEGLRAAARRARPAGTLRR